MRRITEQALLNAYWIPLNFQNAALLTIAVPAVLLRFHGIDHVAVFAMLASLVAAISMVVPPVAGEISDRLHRAGSPRRPVIVLGALVNAAGLIWMMSAASPALFTAAVIVATLGQNVSAAAYSALIPEVVPREDWGAASGYQGVGNLVGSIAGLAVAGAAGSSGTSTTLLIAALFVVAGALTLLAVPEGKYVEGEHAHVSDWPNFAIAFTSRFWTNFGLTLLNTFVLFFFSDVLKVQDASSGTAFVGAAAMVGAIASSIAMGYVSDRVPRKVVVACAGVPMAMAAIGFALVPSLQWILLFAIFFGAGYGAIVSTGWALAIDSVPKLGNVARDLGIWGIAANLPAIFAPQAGRWIVGSFGNGLSGYRVLFIAAGASFLLGSVIVLWTGRRRAARAALPPSAGPLQAFAMTVIHPYYLNAYRIRGWGRLPRRRGATLLISNHQHDLDTTALIMRLSVQGPWMQPIFSAGSRRLFEPGFMVSRVPWIASLARHVDWPWLFGRLGVLPIENEPRRRSLASLAWAVYAHHGDLDVASVFDDRAAHLLNGETRLRMLLGRPPLDKREYVTLSALREPFRSDVVGRERRVVGEDLARLESVLRGGGTLYLTPEGRYTKDGRISRFRLALERLEALGDVYVLALSYDPFANRKLSLLYRVVPAADRGDLHASMAAPRPIVVSQLIATWLRDRENPFRSAEAADGVEALLRGLPAGAFVDPELRADPRGLVERTLTTMTSLGLLVRDGDAYRLAPQRWDKRFPEVADIVDHQANMFEETVTALHQLNRAPRRNAPM